MNADRLLCKNFVLQVLIRFLQEIFALKLIKNVFVKMFYITFLNFFTVFISFLLQNLLRLYYYFLVLFF